ncbi:MAG: ribonuclease H-like domain-containing protein [Chloroflexi bacterium]|nr:ribonuclease H-like domain-containing protein [Chloroflexota bacterium]
MSSLFDRLLRLGPVPDRSPQRRPVVPLSEMVGGAWIENTAGRCLRADARFALDYAHGDLCLRAATEVGATLLKAAGMGEVSTSSLLFLDTETTGLGRDAGTFAFLIGLGSFDGTIFEVRQYFAEEPDDEPAMLRELEGELGQRATLVTFNGVGFDWPLLENRFRYHGLQPPELEGHLDLLRWSRALWRHVLPSCALSSLERQVLGVARTGEDVPGYLIPQLYYDYLRTGNVQPLVGVFYHNLMDVMSMACLMARVSSQMGLEPEPSETPCDLLAIGRLHERLGNHAEARAAYTAATRSPDLRIAAEGWDRYGLLLKRLGRNDEAAMVWSERLEGPSPVPFIELAKHLEHRERDHAAARDVVLRGLARLERGEIDHPWPDDLWNDLNYRLDRLERRLGRSASSAT